MSGCGKWFTAGPGLAGAICGEGASRCRECLDAELRTHAKGQEEA